MTHMQLMSVPHLDRAGPAEAAQLLRPCCASRAWIDAVITGRPYGTLDALITASDGAVDALHWADIEDALAAHPRIGDRAPGADRESSWSRQEQSATAVLGTDAAAELRAGN